MEVFDVGIIGGGVGGYTAAQKSGGAGLKTVIFEEKELGGMYISEGIPSKTLLYSAKILASVQNAKNYGVLIEGKPVFDQEAVIKRKNDVVARLVLGVNAALFASGAVLVSGRAKIIEKTQEGFVIECKEEKYFCKKVIVASGSLSLAPPIKGVDEGLNCGFVLTNKEILNLTQLPKNLLILGGGIIGLEMAGYFAAAGVEVTVIETLGRIVYPLDITIANALQKTLEEKGVRFILSAKVLAVSSGAVKYAKAGEEKEIACDKVLLSVGRRPNAIGIGLEELGVEFRRGDVKTDGKMQTNIEGVYAVGDCNGKMMFAHTASREAIVAVNNILGIEDTMKYDAVPWVIYTSPEVASVGLSEEQAMQKGFFVKIIELPFTNSGRYAAENIELRGLAKAVIDGKKGRLLGFHVLSDYASEFIAQASNLIDLEVDLERIKRLVFPHPTVCEIFKDISDKF